MVRMIDKDRLSEPGRLPSRGIVKPVDSMVGPALKKVGAVLGEEMGADRNLALAQEQERRDKDKALDLARARSDFATRMVGERSKYAYDRDQDYGTWRQRFDEEAPKHMDASAAMIRDPDTRERFLLEAKPDVAAWSSRVDEDARNIDSARAKDATDLAMEQSLQAASAPGVDDASAGKIISDATRSIDGLVESGRITPEEGATRRIKFAQRYAALKLSKEIEQDPEGALQRLTGRPGDTYYDKLRTKESGGNDSARAKGSTAVGRYQFTEGTWRDVMRAHPELGLTVDGRKDSYQQERAIRAFTADNAAILEQNGIVANEANLYLAHFMGAGGALQLLKADPGANAAQLFPEAAKANPSIFFGKMGPRSVAQVIALQTKGFNSYGKPADKTYDMLAADDRLRLASGAQAEAARRWKAENAASDLKRYQTRTAINDDVEQIEQTGQASDINPGAVVEVLGEDDAAKWLDRRDQAARIFKAKSEIDTLPDSKIAEYLDSIEPRPGTDDFARRQAVYEKAEAHAKKLQDLRLKDPAQSVAESDLVKQAEAQVDYEKPDTVQNLIGARLAVQEAVGIPAAMRQPVTRKEAYRIIAPMQKTFDLWDAELVAAAVQAKGSPTARRQAAKDAQARAEGQIRGIIDEVEKTYGPYAEQVLAFSIAESVRDKEIGNLAAVAMRKIAQRQPLSKGDLQALDAANETSLAAKAVQGELPKPKGSAPPEAGQRPVPFRFPTGRGPLPPGPKYPFPDQADIEALIANPDQAGLFDSIFGPGASKQWMPAQ